MQHERACNGGYKLLMFERTETSFDPALGSIPVIDLAAVSAGDKKLPRRDTHREELTALGRECFDRAKLETDRRHTMKGSKPGEMDYVAAGCDLRIVGRGVLSEGDMAKVKMYTQTAHEKYKAKYEGSAPETEPQDEAEIVYVRGIPISVSGKKKQEEKKQGTISCPEFEDAWENWLLASSHMKWKERFPDPLKQVENEESIDTVNDLLTLNVLKNVYKEFIADPDDCGFFVLYGYLPQLALCYIGANLASSFCERVNSCAKNIMTHDRTMLSDHHLEMLCYLRMNRDYIYYLKIKYPHIMREWQAKQLAALCSE